MNEPNRPQTDDKTTLPTPRHPIRRGRHDRTPRGEKGSAASAPPLAKGARGGRARPGKLRHAERVPRRALPIPPRTAVQADALGDGGTVKAICLGCMHRQEVKRPAPAVGAPAEREVDAAHLAALVAAAPGTPAPALAGPVHAAPGGATIKDACKGCGQRSLRPVPAAA